MIYFFFFSSRRRHTRLTCDWSSDVCSSDLPSRAKELMLSGRQIRAEEALAIGLVNRTVEPDGVLEAALAWAAELAAGPLVAQGLAKAAVDAGLQRPLPDGLALELEAFDAVFETEDAR